MDSKRGKSPSLNKSRHSSNSKKKRPSSSRQKNQKQSFTNIAVAQSFTQAKKTKKVGLVKKKLEQIKQPELILKVTYKKKKLSIPLSSLDEKGISEVMESHIMRFEKQILKNNVFSYSSIQGWKTIAPGDVLKDYYFQTEKSLKVFKSQVIEIEPIWKVAHQDPVKLSDFQIIRCIGTGGFSRVFLAKYSPTGKFYALKLMEKEGLFDSGKECVVTNEREIMSDLNHPQILQLQFAFETKHFVALALEYCPGGQLFYYLRKVRRMSEDEARYCFVEILLGIQYLHSKKIIYRDIKPENIMIDKDGNLKIADFGLSKKGIRPSELAYTFCGSPEYMAPEMITKAGHTFSVDYYCLGALLYELVTGSPPFYSREVQKIYYSIQNEEIDFPSHVDLSNQIKMLLEGLLVKDPKRRLGSLGGIREILGHPWVRKIKPSDIMDKAIETPIQIDLLTFNINEEQIDVEDGFAEKLRLQQDNFEQIFDDFYFNRSASIKILDEALPSAKSDSTKENKSLNNKGSSKEKISKNTVSKEQLTKYPIKFKNTENSSKIISEIRANKPKKMKRKNSKKNFDWVIKGRERPEKSRNKFQGKEIIRERVMSPNKSTLVKNSLKRIKSSTALHDKLQRK